MGGSPIDYDSVAEIYDLYVTADYDVPFFVGEAERAEGPVLELMAGTGRLSLPLVRAGVRLTCVDASATMLAVLARKLEAEDLAAEVVRSDVCELALPDRYTLAVLPFQSFMEVVGEERQRRALASVHRCLAPRGRFVVTLHNPTVRRAQVDGARREVCRCPLPDGGTLVVSGVESGGDPVVRRRQIFEFLGSDGDLRFTRELAMEFALIGREEFDALARDAGFRVLDLVGDYDRSPFDAARSPFLIWRLEKVDTEAGSIHRKSP